MAKKKYYDKEIDKTTDWGGDSSTGNLPVVGGRVQEFIKNTLSAKAGAFLFDEDKNSYLVFADAQDEAKYIQSGGMMGELILSEIKMADPGVDFRASSLTATNFATAETSNVFIKYTWSSLDKDEADTGNGTVVLSVAGRTVFTGFVPQGENSIDISRYLIAGENNIRLTITDSYSNSRTIAYVVNLVSLRITSSYDPSTINSGDITFRYIPIGSALKTAHFIVDGVEVATREIATSGSQITQILPAQTHGAHSLKVYLSANIGGSEVMSNELYYDIISVEEGRTETIIASTFDTVSMVEFETISIPYVVYTPTSGTSEVQLKADDEVLQDVVVNRTLQTWSYKAMRSGSIALEITSNGVSKSISLNVSESEVNVRPEENDLKLFLTSQNRSNQQLNKTEWKYGDISAQLTGFDFATNGWVRDINGSMALKVSNEARVNIPYKMFQSEFRNIGKTIEFEFMPVEMSDPKAVIISSMHNDVGFEITSQSAYFSSEQTSISTRFKENERVRIAFVVNKVSDNRLIQIYINGILSGVQQYPNADSFMQSVAQNISIGGEGCSVMVYNIRVYDNNLSQEQLLNNYIGDMDNIDLKVEIFYRNELYDAYGNISYERALQYVPCLIIEGKLPESKGDKRPVNIYYENLQDPSKSYTSTNAQIDVQGTSSQYYPRKNWKIKHKNFTTEAGVESKYKLRDISVPESTFTYKADFMESSGTHNTGLAVYYESAWRQLGFTVPVQDEGYTNNIRTTVDGFPILIFHRETPDSYLEFTGKYNFNNDKTEATFGFKPGMVSWETKNNTSPRILFESADFTSLDINGKPDWLNDYEDRYPDDKYAIPFRMQRLTEWVISCKDNPDKFALEVGDYFDMNSLLFFYIMTEFTAGIDQRGKNMFYTWYEEDDYGTDKCYLIFYDNDTAFGLNNEGELLFDYGVEYHDKIGSGVGAANVWNAESSELWKLVEEALAPQIEALYVRMRAENVISYEKLMYHLDDVQSSKWSESIYNEDGKFKYINPLLEDGNGAYLYALQGSRAEHRKWWIYNRILYMDSKYSTATHLSDYASMRLYTPPAWQGIAPNPDFTLTALNDGYARVKFGSYIIKKRIKGGITDVIKAPVGMTFGDTETIVYGAKALSSIGDLSDKYVGTLDVSKATNLTELIVGSTAEGYSNQNLTALSVGNNNLLTKLNIANCSNLIQSIDLKGCPSIKEIEATGSRISGVELPDGGSLTYLSLPAVTTLTLKKQTLITNSGIKLDGYDKLTTLVIEDSPNINPFTLLNRTSKLNRLRLTGLDGSSQNTSGFEQASLAGGIDDGGNFLPISYLQGRWNLDTISAKDLAHYSTIWQDLEITADNIVTLIKMTMNTASGFNGNLILTSIEDVSLSVMFAGVEVTKSMIGGIPTVFDAPSMVYDNTTVNILGADAIKQIGDLSYNYLGQLDISEVDTVEKVIVGNEVSGYSNPYFTDLELGNNNESLEVVNIANCPNFVGELNLTSCPNIKEVKTIGSGVSKVIFPSTYSLTYLSLPAVESISLINQTELTEANFKMGGYSALKSLVVENSPSINSINIVERALQLNNLRLVGINGSSKDTKAFRNAYSISDSYISGVWNFEIISREEYDLYTSRWADLTITADNITSGLEMIMTEPLEPQTLEFSPDLTLISNFTFNAEIKYGTTTTYKNLIKDAVTIVSGPEMEYNNTVVNIYAASLLKSMGQLGKNYLVSLDASKVSNFKELLIGSGASGYTNTNFTNLILGSSLALETLDVTNCVNFSQEIDLTKCPNMKVVKASNTLVPKVNLHPTAKLTTLHLPDGILDLNLSNQSLLTNLSVGSITSLSVDGDTGFSIISLINSKPSLEKVRLTGIDVSEQLSDWIDLANSDIQGMNADGTVCPLGDAIYGEYFVYSIDEERYSTLVSAFPNLVITYGQFVEPPVIFVDPEIGLALFNKGLILSPTEATKTELGSITTKQIDNIFRSNTNITSFPEFQYFTSITDIDFISMGMFYQASNLVDIILPESVTIIGVQTFYECFKLSSVNIPPSVTNIKQEAFNGCKALKTIDIPEGVTQLGSRTFEASGLTSVTLPSTIESIASYCFARCTAMRSVTILNPTPPTITLGNWSGSFAQYDYNFYVPAGSVNAYKTATNWSQFADRIFPIV